MQRHRPRTPLREKQRQELRRIRDLPLLVATNATAEAPARSPKVTSKTSPKMSPKTSPKQTARAVSPRAVSPRAVSPSSDGTLETAEDFLGDSVEDLWVKPGRRTSPVSSESSESSAMTEFEDLEGSVTDLLNL